MPAKRKLDAVSDISMKKAKVEQYVTSPFDVDAMIREIGKYLEGEHIVDFKLACKKINNAMKEIKPEPMELTLESYERVAVIPGHHFIKIGNWAEATVLLERMQLLKSKRITNLLVDYCGESAEYSLRPPDILDQFRNLYSFKVIKCVNYFSLDIGPKYDNLHTLEIYSSTYVKLYLYREIENVRLYSEQKYMGSPTIEIRTSREYMEYAKKISCYATLRRVCDDSMEIVDMISRKDFVPNPKFL